MPWATALACDVNSVFFGTVSSQCGLGNTTRPLELSGEGQVSSPNFPNDYFNSADCQWRITSTSQVIMCCPLYSGESVP